MNQPSEYVSQIKVWGVLKTYRSGVGAGHGQSDGEDGQKLAKHCVGLEVDTSSLEAHEGVTDDKECKRAAGENLCKERRWELDAKNGS